MVTNHCGMDTCKVKAPVKRPAGQEREKLSLYPMQCAPSLVAILRSSKPKQGSKLRLSDDGHATVLQKWGAADDRCTVPLCLVY